MLNRFREEVLSFVKMCAGLAAVSFILYGLLRLLSTERFPAVNALYGTAGYDPSRAAAVNLLTPLALLTAGLLACFYFLFMRYMAGERAERFAVGTGRPNHLAALRDYLAVILFVFTAVTLAWRAATGGYFVTVATLVGVITGWWVMSMIVNVGGYAERPFETLRDLAVVMLLLAAGKIAPAALSGLTGNSLLEYFIELGIVYSIGPGIGLLCWPGLGITLPLSKNRFLAQAQALGVTLFTYFSMIAFALLPSCLLLVPAVLIVGIAAIVYGLAGSISSLGDFSGALFDQAVFPKGNGLVPAAAFAPVMYFVNFIGNLARGAVTHWSGALELAAFLGSLHYTLWKYRTRIGKDQWADDDEDMTAQEVKPAPGAPGKKKKKRK